MIFTSGSKIPKAELHIHMEGSVSLDTANAIAARKGLRPFPDSFYNVHSVDDFTGVFIDLACLMIDEEDFYDIAREFTARQARDGIVLTETFIQPSFHTRRGVSAEDLFRGVERGLEEGEKQHGIQVRVICSVSRVYGTEAALETLDMVERYAGEKVIGIDLAGVKESSLDPERYAPVFEAARAIGLRTVAHSGEFSSSNVLRKTIDLIKPERIGHGIAAWQDKELVALMADMGIPLEICPTSNITLAATPSADEHPVKRLYEMGVPIVINTDDPALYNITLSDEFELLQARFGFSRAEIQDLIEAGFRHSFVG